jgi:ketosteroid isomerase-like protein
MEKRDERRFVIKTLFSLSAFMAGSILTFRNKSFSGTRIGQTEAHGMDSSDKRLGALEARVQAMEDIEAIKQLQYRYKNAFMQANWDEVIGCFAEDATIDIKPDGTNVGKGITEIKRQFGNMAKVHVGAETDFIYHPIISVSGSKGKGTWMVTDTMHIIDQPDQSIYGIYTVEYVKVNRLWKISFLRHRHRTIKPAAASLGPPAD